MENVPVTIPRAMKEKFVDAPIETTLPDEPFQHWSYFGLAVDATVALATLTAVAVSGEHFFRRREAEKL